MRSKSGRKCTEKETDIQKESESEEETGERYPYQSCNEGNPEIACFIPRWLLIKSKILGKGLKIPSRCCPERRKIRFFNGRILRVLLKNVVNMHKEKDLLSKSRALHESLPSAAKPHVYTQ